MRNTGSRGRSGFHSSSRYSHWRRSWQRAPGYRQPGSRRLCCSTASCSRALTNGIAKRGRTRRETARDRASELESLATARPSDSQAPPWPRHRPGRLSPEVPRSQGSRCELGTPSAPAIRQYRAFGACTFAANSRLRCRSLSEERRAAGPTNHRWRRASQRSSTGDQGFCFGLADSESGSAVTGPVSATMQKRGGRSSGPSSPSDSRDSERAWNCPRDRSVPKHDGARWSASRSLACRATRVSRRAGTDTRGQTEAGRTTPRSTTR